MVTSRVLFVFLAFAAASGCAESSLTPASPSSVVGSPAVTVSQLAGTWNLVSIQPVGEGTQDTPTGASYTLTFDDGRISTRADCNMCRGPFTLSGQDFAAGPVLACTRAACPTMTFEHTYTGLLGGEGTIALSGDVLVLSSTRGVLRFSR
jgi:heat shock protein HslJ